MATAIEGDGSSPSQIITGKMAKARANAMNPRPRAAVLTVGFLLRLDDDAGRGMTPSAIELFSK